MARVWAFLALLWIITTAEVSARLNLQEPYRDPKASSSSDPTLVIVLVVLAAVVAFVIAMARRSKGTPSARAEAGPAPDPRPFAPPAPRPSAAAPSAGPSIFISYRRADTADITGRITDRLAQTFGRPAIFTDVNSIHLGRDFRKEIREGVGKCNALLVVIGRNWLTAVDGDRRRLDDPADHLRLEIETALERDIPVIPILVQDARMPREEELPASLRPLAFRHGVPVRPDPDFAPDLERLIGGLISQIPAAR